MGAGWYKGSYDERIIVVESNSDSCARDCQNIGLVRMNDKDAAWEDGLVERTGYLAPGILRWHEKPDHTAIARRQQAEQEKQAQEDALREQQAAKEKADREAKEEQERVDRETKAKQERQERLTRELQQRAERVAHEQELVDQANQRIAQARETRLSQLAMLLTRREQAQDQTVDEQLLGLEQDVLTQSEALAEALRLYEENGYDAVITDRIANEIEDRRAIDLGKKKQSEFRTVVVM